MSNQATVYRLLAGTLPGAPCFTTPQELLDLFAQHLTVSFSNTSSFFNLGSTEPPPERRTDPWFKLDGAGRPVGFLYYYNGSWRRFYTETPGDIKWFTGSGGDFDSTGLGKINTNQDGWALCNGQNGTVDLRDRFIVGANQYSSSVWKTNIEGTLKARNPDVEGPASETSFLAGAFKLTRDHILPETTPSGTVQPDVEFYFEHGTIVGNAHTPAAPNGQKVQGPIVPIPAPPYYALGCKMFLGFP